MNLSRQCFVIFEGGGAKGITHLGALKAIETVGLARVGAAGTSAGAIIAALTAVGYSSDELFDPVLGRDVLSDLKLSPVDLLGKTDWLLFRGMRLNIVLAVSIVLLPVLASVYAFSLTRTTSVPRFFASAWRIIDYFGFFSTDGAKDVLNTILLKKVAKPDATGSQGLVRFKDIDPSVKIDFCPLKIIATNLTSGRLQIFDHNDPYAVVADAVAASFSIPIFFKPTKVRRVDDDGVEITDPQRVAVFADGGLVSNLPVWVFAEEKRIVERVPENQNYPPIPIVAFTLEDAIKQTPSTSRWPIGALLPLLAFTKDVLNTAIFGGQSVVQDFVPNLTIVKMPTPLGLLDFDCTRDDADHAVDLGCKEAVKVLERELQRRPLALQKALDALLAKVIDDSATLRGAGKALPHFRASLIERFGRSSFKVVAAANMDGDADDALLIDTKNPGAPRAYEERRMTFLDVSDPGAVLWMTKYERALLRPSLQSIISIPVFEMVDAWASQPIDRGKPSGVLCIDSDGIMDLEFAHAGFREMLATRSIQFFSREIAR